MLMHTVSKWMVELSVSVKVDTAEMGSPAAVSLVLNTSFVCIQVRVTLHMFTVSISGESTNYGLTLGPALGSLVLIGGLLLLASLFAIIYCKYKRRDKIGLLRDLNGNSIQQFVCL